MNDTIHSCHAECERPECVAGREKVGAWLPIDSAPRGSGEDGPRDTRHADYVKPPMLLLWTQDGPIVGYYDWYYHPGYGFGSAPGESAWRDSSHGPIYGATYWMPFPKAPA